tara:strand:- start:274 stop:441 length:168 start_codon:yes stop_codon:yes gene_type:complete
MTYFIQCEINHRWYNKSQGQNERLTRIRAKQFALLDQGKRYRVVDENENLIDLIT